MRDTFADTCSQKSRPRAGLGLTFVAMGAACLLTTANTMEPGRQIDGTLVGHTKQRGASLSLAVFSTYTSDGEGKANGEIYLRARGES